MPFLAINRTYRLVHRAIIPITGFRDLASYLRYGTEIESPLFHFPSVLRVVFIDSFPLSGND